MYLPAYIAYTVKKDVYMMCRLLFPRVMFARARFIEIFFVVNFNWNVLIGAPGRCLYKKIINPSKMLASVKLMYYIGFN